MATPHARYSVTRRIPFQAFGAPLFYALAGVGVGNPGELLTRLEVFLRGTITFSGGTASGTSQGENPGGLCALVEVDATPIPGSPYVGGKIKKLFPRSVLRQNIFDTGRFQNDPSGAIAGGATSYTINLRMPLYFALPGAYKSMDTSLPLAQFSQVLLTITNSAAVTAMLAGNDRTVDVSGLYYEIVEYRELNPNFVPVGTLYESDFTKAITQANTRFTLDSELSKTEAYLEVLLVTESTNQALVDTILNRSTWNSGSDQFEDRYQQNVRARMQDEITEVASTSLTGLFHYNFAEGLLTKAVPDVNAVLDVSNPGTDRLIVRTRRFVPRAQAA